MKPVAFAHESLFEQLNLFLSPKPNPGTPKLCQTRTRTCCWAWIAVGGEKLHMHRLPTS